MTFAAHVDAEIISALQARLRQVEDERDAQARAIASLNTERDQLRAALQAEVEKLDPETALAEQRASAFWFAAWRNTMKSSAERALRIVQLETWMRETGQELARMQYRCTLLQTIADSVRASDPTDAIGTVKVHYNDPDGGPCTEWVHDAIDFANRRST